MMASRGGKTEEMSASRQRAEDMAVRVLAARGPNGVVTISDFRSVLELWKCKRNYCRLKVRPIDKDWIHSDTFGLVWARDGRWCVTHLARKYPNVTRVVNGYVNANMPHVAKGQFKFSAFSLNHGFASRRHRDAGNAGPSAVTAVGKFSGGDLKYWDNDDLSSSIEGLPADKATTLNARNHIAMFDGRRAHEAMPFTGERWSIVWFANTGAWNAAELHPELEDLGFVPPATADGCNPGSWFFQPTGYGPKRFADSRSDTPAVATAKARPSKLLQLKDKRPQAAVIEVDLSELENCVKVKQSGPCPGLLTKPQGDRFGPRITEVMPVAWRRRELPSSTHVRWDYCTDSTGAEAVGGVPKPCMERMRRKSRKGGRPESGQWKNTGMCHHG